MKRAAITLLLLFASSTAFAHSLRSERHLVTIDVQKLSESSRQYDVQIFDAETRTPVTRLQVLSRDNRPEEAETSAEGTHYKVRVEPHGASYLIDFTADDGSGEIEQMRAGFQPPPASFAPPAEPLRAGREIAEPEVLRRVEAVYTEEARAGGVAGTVIVDAIIDRSGFVRDAKLVKRLGSGLDESALDAVRQWQFAPSMQERTPVEVVYEITFVFEP